MLKCVDSLSIRADDAYSKLMGNLDPSGTGAEKLESHLLETKDTLPMGYDGAGAVHEDSQGQLHTTGVYCNRS